MGNLSNLEKLYMDGNNLQDIPEGFAHGFLALEDNTLIQYKCSNFYNKETEGGLIWNDPDININWGIGYEPIISDKDKNNVSLKNLNSSF
jgi:dTDP-4-dehydrorhamnose 3,5-epimerase